MTERLRHMRVRVSLATDCATTGRALAHLPPESLANQHLVQAERLLAGQDFGSVQAGLDRASTERPFLLMELATTARSSASACCGSGKRDGSLSGYVAAGDEKPCEIWSSLRATWLLGPG